MFYSKREGPKTADTAHFNIVIGKVEAHMAPNIIDDMANMIEYCRNYFLSKDLK